MGYKTKHASIYYILCRTWPFLRFYSYANTLRHAVHNYSSRFSPWTQNLPHISNTGLLSGCNAAVRVGICTSPRQCKPQILFRNWIQPTIPAFDIDHIQILKNNIKDDDALWKAQSFQVITLTGTAPRSFAHLTYDYFLVRINTSRSPTVHASCIGFRVERPTDRIQLDC